jgi:hypothetical protein
MCAGPKILRAAQPVRWVALNFLDFLVLFHQGKRTRKKNKKKEQEKIQ